MSKTRISIDLDKLNKAIQEYANIINDFKTAIKQTEQAIDILKNTDWKSGASTAYFMQYEDTWKKNMETRIKILEHLLKCMIFAKLEYESIYEWQEALDKELD